MADHPICNHGETACSSGVSSIYICCGARVALLAVLHVQAWSRRSVRHQVHTMGIHSIRIYRFQAAAIFYPISTQTGSPAEPKAYIS
jgi:hypothetical protein